MYLVARDNTFDPERLAQNAANLAEFQAAHAAQDGYQGSVTADFGNGRQLTITLWRSKDDAEAARVALAPTIGEALQPLMAAPSTLVGVGEVIFDDLGERHGIDRQMIRALALEVLKAPVEMPWIESVSWVKAVNQFWFEDLGPADWFGGGARIDAAIRSRFGDLLEDLRHDPPIAENLDAEGLVAAVIVFDQFSRNLFRKSPEAYATDALALALACQAVDRDLDAGLGLHQRQFLYMPFMHSESAEMQARSMALFRELGSAELIRYAEHHRDVIERFGRFPHRNSVLGRENTPEEREFLRTEPAYS
jgi:uncharacterized protein (DUF924 family)